MKNHTNVELPQNAAVYCDRCIRAILSRGEDLKVGDTLEKYLFDKGIDVDEDEEFKCEFCEEAFPPSDLKIVV